AAGHRRLRRPVAQRALGRLRRVAAAALRRRRTARRAGHDAGRCNGGAAMSTPAFLFHARARLLHWLMAPLLIAMLFIGIGMVSTASSAYALLLATHKPLGVAILVLLVLRIAVRLRHRPPPLPADLPPSQRRAATFSHWLLYALMLAMPMTGWAMLSAAGHPVTLG